MTAVPGDERPRLRAGVIRRGNSWSYVIRVTDARGVNRPRWVGGFRTEDEAKEARDRARVAARRGEYVDRTGVTVEQYLRQWLDAHALEVKPRTRAGYEHLLNRYVFPRIGRERLQALRPATLSSLYRDLLEHGAKDGGPLSARSVEYVHAVLRKALGDAVRIDQILTANPAERAKRPRKCYAPPRGSVWTAGQLAAFLASTRDHRLHAFFRLAAYTGARRGELLHLRWSDVSLVGDPTIWIRGSVGIVDGKRVEGTTKGGRERVVSLDPGTAGVLVEHRQRQEWDRDRACGSWVPGDLVFRMEIGAPLFPDTPTALMTKLLTRHNEQATASGLEALPVIRLHDLRHIHATLLLGAGVPVHVVSARLGHADPAITLRVYAHVLSDQATRAAEAFAAILDPAQGSEGPAPMDGPVSKSVSKEVQQ